MKKNNQILIGTHNECKFKEIGKLISKKFKKISPVSLKIKAPKETGITFQSNSKLKANFFFKKSKLISLSDDSGIEIFALNKKPGVYSARWAKKNGSFKVLKELAKGAADHEVILDKNMIIIPIMTEGKLVALKINK